MKTNCQGDARPSGQRSKRRGASCVAYLLLVAILLIVYIAAAPSIQGDGFDMYYRAEAIPLVGNLRTLIAMYQVERSHLPGLPLKADGTLDEVLADRARNPGGASILWEGATALQGFERLRGEGTEGDRYRPSVYATLGATKRLLS